MKHNPEVNGTATIHFSLPFVQIYRSPLRTVTLMKNLSWAIPQEGIPLVLETGCVSLYGSNGVTLRMMNGYLIDLSFCVVDMQ